MAKGRFKEWLLEKRWRIIIAGVLTVAVPVVGLAAYVYCHVVSEFEQVAFEENRTLFNLALYHLREKIDSDISSGKTIATRPDFIGAVGRNNAGAVREHLKNLIENSDTVERAVVTSPGAIVLADYPHDPLAAGKDFSRSEWCKGIYEKWSPYVSNLYFEETAPRRYLFAIAVPVKGPSGEVIGILVLLPREDYLRSILASMSIGGGFVYAVDRKGNLLYHPYYTLDRLIDFSVFPIVMRIKKGLGGVEKTVDPVNNEEVIATYDSIKEWGWGVVMQRPEREISNRVRKIAGGLFVLGGFFLLAGSVVAYRGMELLFSVRRLSVRLKEQEAHERQINERLLSTVVKHEETEKKLEQTLGDLERSNRELEQFAYVASHDLQEPLRKISSFTELLQKRYRERLDPDADRFMEHVVDGAKRMSVLINDLLAYSRLERGERKFAPADCTKVIECAVSDMQVAIQESAATVTYDDLPVVLADEAQMCQVFYNLIGNALKFRGDEPPRIHVSATREEGAWKFSVSDNGIGIDPEYFTRIFVMFQRLHTRAEYAGTGIGLAICKKIIDRHGGRIWVESKAGAGATFYFTLPERRRGERAWSQREK